MKRSVCSQSWLAVCRSEVCSDAVLWLRSISRASALTCLALLTSSTCSPDHSHRHWPTDYTSLKPPDYDGACQPRRVRCLRFDSLALALRSADFLRSRFAFWHRKYAGMICRSKLHKKLETPVGSVVHMQHSNLTAGGSGVQPSEFIWA